MCLETTTRQAKQLRGGIPSVIPYLAKSTTCPFLYSHFFSTSHLSNAVVISDSPDLNIRLPQLNLYVQDGVIIHCSFAWVTDSIISVAQALLRDQSKQLNDENKGKQSAL